MPVSAGRCSACETVTWRVAVQQKTLNKVPAGSVILLWPMPETLCASFWTPTGQTQHVDFCQAHAPGLGALSPVVLTSQGEPIPAGGCVEVVRARDRYTAWFQPAWGAWLSVHLRDQMGYDDEGASAIEAMWRKDAET